MNLEQRDSLQNSIVEKESVYEVGEDIYIGGEKGVEHGKMEANLKVEAFL